MNPQSFSFIASSDKAHAETHCITTQFKSLPQLTKTAAVFGPNAGGKTNLLMALRTMRELVVRSSSYSESEIAGAYTPFRPGASERQPTEFLIDLLLAGVRYIYSFSYDSQRIVAESLYVHHGRKSQRWFSRRRNESGAEIWAPFSPGMSGPRDEWRKATGSRSLFLSVAGRAGAPHIREVWHWVAHHLTVVLAPDITNPSVFASRVGDPGFKARVLGVLHAVDIQIDDIRVMQIGGGPQSSCAQVTSPQTIELLHRRRGTSPVWLDFAHESAGIQRLIHILGALLEVIEAGTFVAIDEVDGSLHPLVARFLIRLINDPQASRGAQLMFSSHDNKLMDPDILRRDQVWLMELDANHASKLSALSDQKPRKHERVGKNYLHGNFGAIPVIKPEKWRDVAVEGLTRPAPR